MAAGWFDFNGITEKLTTISESVNTAYAVGLVSLTAINDTSQLEDEQKEVTPSISTRCLQVVETTVNTLKDETVRKTCQIEEFATTTFGSVSNTITQLANSTPFKYDADLCTEVSFNQDCTTLNVGFEEGYALYSLKKFKDPMKIYDSGKPKNIHIVERLFGTYLVIIVSKDQPRKLIVNNYHKKTQISCHIYLAPILSVRLNSKRVIVCLEESIHIHNIYDMKTLHVIKDIVNPLGLIDLSSKGNCYLAYPGPVGSVHIFDADTLNFICQFTAHENPLASISFNSDGTRLATASQKGTVIRVFEIPSGTSLFEFTRGLTRCVTIHSLAFSSDSRLLCSSSNTETIHVFSLVRIQIVEKEGNEESQSWVNYFSQQATAYLPTHMNELMLREKSFCTARLPMSGTKTVVGIPIINGKHYLFCASSDGYLFCFNLENITGSECKLSCHFQIGPNYRQSNINLTDKSQQNTISIKRKSSNNQITDFNFDPFNPNQIADSNLTPFDDNISLQIPLIPNLSINEENLIPDLIELSEEIDEDELDFMSVVSSFDLGDIDEVNQ